MFPFLLPGSGDYSTQQFLLPLSPHKTYVMSSAYILYYSTYYTRRRCSYNAEISEIQCTKWGICYTNVYIQS